MLENDTYQELPANSGIEMSCVGQSSLTKRKKTSDEGRVLGKKRSSNRSRRKFEFSPYVFTFSCLFNRVYIYMVVFAQLDSFKLSIVSFPISSQLAE